jgi:hypothetical protein
MNYVDCKTQKELDAALKLPNTMPNLVGAGKFEVDGSSQVAASGASQVTAYGSSQVAAYGSSQVTASGSSQVAAYGSSQVTASGSSQVTAYESSQVTAYGSAQVRASGSSQVTAYGKYVAVTRSGKNVKAMGGVQIDSIPPQDLAEWFEEYGITPVDGVVILYKAVDSDFMSERRGNYAPGETPESDEWDAGRQECGSGLHFCGTPHHALGFYVEAQRFVGCPVAVDSIAMHVGGDYPQKVKAPRVVAPGCFEVDINGKRL